MKTIDFKNKAEELLNRFTSIKKEVNQWGYNGSEYDDIEREFIHLVYAFDSELPMFKEMTAVSKAYNDQGSKVLNSNNILKNISVSL